MEEVVKAVEFVNLKLSSEWVLWVKKPSLPIYGVQWGIGRKEEGGEQK